MLQEIKTNYLNESLQIGMVNWREVYLLQPCIIKMNVEVDEGRLVFTELLDQIKELAIDTILKNTEGVLLLKESRKYHECIVLTE